MKFKSLHDFGKHLIPDEKLFNIFWWMHQEVDVFEKSELYSNGYIVEISSISNDMVECKISHHYSGVKHYSVVKFSFPVYILKCQSDIEMYIKIKGWMNERTSL